MSLKRVIFFYCLFPVQLFSMEGLLSDIHLDFNEEIYARLFREVSEVVEVGDQLESHESNGALQIYRELRMDMVMNGVETFMNSGYAAIRQLMRILGESLDSHEKFTLLLVKFCEIENRAEGAVRHLYAGVTQCIIRRLQDEIGMVDPGYAGYAGTHSDEERNKIWLKANAHLTIQNHRNYLKAGILIRYYLLHVLQMHGVNPH